MIDNYCERVGPGLLAEPVNAVTNISFFIAAWFVWLLIKKNNQATIALYVLPALILCIGAGSSLFHTFANGWSALLDIIPIFLFQICILWLYGRNIIRLGFATTALIILIFLTANFIALQFPALLNGSLMYLPALSAILGLAIFHAYTQTNERWILLLAFFVFCISLFFRTIDAGICEEFPLGTHFIWHILNSIVLYLIARAVIRTHTLLLSRVVDSGTV